MDSFGLYRMTFGSEIVESSFNDEEQCIGPYHIPVEIHLDKRLAQGSSIPRYKFYERMQYEKDALAVFNVNNYCIAVLSKDGMHMIHTSAKDTEPLPSYCFDPPMPIPEYEHIGFVKTYQKCKAVHTYPWYMVRVVGSNEAVGFKDEIKGRPLLNPPLSLYKELVDTNYNGCYFDTITNKTIFIN